MSGNPRLQIHRKHVYIFHLTRCANNFISLMAKSGNTAYGVGGICAWIGFGIRSSGQPVFFIDAKQAKPGGINVRTISGIWGVASNVSPRWYWLVWRVTELEYRLLLLGPAFVINDGCRCCGGKYLGRVTALRLSCYLFFCYQLIAKPSLQDSRTFVAWAIYFCQVG